jgi:20S proteasome subunit beta 4
VDDTPQLYWCDYISNMVKLPFAAQGYASYFCMSTMDRYWKPDLTVDEAKALLRKCLDELKVRFVANLPEFNVKLITKDGIESVQL